MISADIPRLHGEITKARKTLSSLLSFIGRLERGMESVAKESGLPVEGFHYMYRQLSYSPGSLESNDLLYRQVLMFGNRYDEARGEFDRLLSSVKKVSSLVENLNGRIRVFIEVKRVIPTHFFILLKVYFNTQRYKRSRCKERVGKSPLELLTGTSQQGFLEATTYTYDATGNMTTSTTTCTMITISGQILYQPSPRPAKVELLDSSGITQLGSAETAADGSYTLSLPTAPADTTYTLKITKPGYLSYTIQNFSLTPGERIETINISQLAGDVNGDGVINAEDLTSLLSVFNKPPGDNLQEADIDGNGIVNAVDLTYLAFVSLRLRYALRLSLKSKILALPLAYLLAGFNKQDVVIQSTPENQL